MWNDLTLKEKAEIMKMSVANGVTDINDIQQLYDDSIYAEGGHIYDKAGPLNKAKQQPKYQYGIIEQVLRENGVNFRVTSGARKPNQAGNAGKSSAHTYTIFGNSPGAIDIVPGVGSDWNTLFAQMNSPRVRKALAAYGLDVLNETNPNVMASTHATGPHLHVGRGIKGQAGMGQMFGGTSYGGGKGDMYAPTYGSRGSSRGYDSGYQNFTSDIEPITIEGGNRDSGWLSYIASVNKPISFNTPIGATTLDSNLSNAEFTPTDFSMLNSDVEMATPLNPTVAKRNMEYSLGLENNALWNSPYLMFNAHSGANGGHLFYPGGRFYNIKIESDNTDNVVRPINRMIQVKQKDTPARREKETREYKARQERAKYTPANPRQASIGPYREKTALDKQGGRLYAEAEQRRKDAEDRKAAGVVLNSLFKPILPSTYVDMATAIKNGQVNSLTDALAAPYLSDSWSMRNPGKALATDIIAPAAIGKGLSLIKGDKVNRLAKIDNSHLFQLSEAEIKDDRLRQFLNKHSDPFTAINAIYGDFDDFLQLPVPLDVEREFLGTVHPRLANRGVKFDILKMLDKTHYNELPEYLYETANHPEVMGTYNPITDNIVINRYTKNKPHKFNRALGHEIRHKLYYNLPSEENKTILDELKTAYGEDLWEDVREFPTINYDIRHKLFENNPELFSAPLSEQNSFIDNAKYSDLLNAIANADGYGRSYYDNLIKGLSKDNPEHKKMVQDRLNKIRVALKNVPGVLPFGVGYGVYKNQ